MSGINSGILRNASPLSATQIKEVEKDAILNNKCIAYLDENNDICFAQPDDPEGIKRLAWNNAYQVFEQDSSFIKKVYNKTGLDSFVLDKVLEKNNIDDSWSEENSPISYTWDGNIGDKCTLTILAFGSNSYVLVKISDDFINLSDAYGAKCGNSTGEFVVSTDNTKTLHELGLTEFPEDAWCCNMEGTFDKNALCIHLMSSPEIATINGETAEAGTYLFALMDNNEIVFYLSYLTLPAN